VIPNLELAEQAILAYEDPNFFAGNVSARILVRASRTIIAVTGSNDRKDWIQDGEGYLVKRSEGYQVFKGFADMAESSKDAFLAYIKSFPAPYFGVAHSAGNPILTRWALWMAQVGQKPSFIQLLAAPCTGNKDFASHYNSHEIPTVSIGLSRDPVCEAYESRGGVPVVPTLWLDEQGQEAQKDPCILGAFTEHPGKNYLRAIRQYLKAG